MHARRAMSAALLASLFAVACTGSPDAPPAQDAPRADSGSGGFFFNPGALPGLFADCGAAPLRDARADSRSDAATCVASEPVTFTRDVKPIFNQCSGEVCHNGTWGSGDPYSYLVGMKASECCDGRLRVDPGNPSGSYVIQKLTGQHLCRGVQMPPNVIVPPAQIRTLEDWICLGARND